MPPPDPVLTLERALGELAGAPVTLERPSDARHGDYATNVALRLAGSERRPPRDVAADLAERVSSVDGVASVDVAGPGFLNVTMDDAWLAGALADVVVEGRRFGAGSAETPERIQVELVSANPTGPITVASARNGAYGDAVARLFEFAGHAVEREYYYNDAGADGPLPRVRRGVPTGGGPTGRRVPG
jgi:arginyl-tRNA synthetase